MSKILMLTLRVIYMAEYEWYLLNYQYFLLPRVSTNSPKINHWMREDRHAYCKINILILKFKCTKCLTYGTNRITNSRQSLISLKCSKWHAFEFHSRQVNKPFKQHPSTCKNVNDIGFYCLSLNLSSNNLKNHLHNLKCFYLKYYI